jgi:hypothetical protein
MNSTIFTRLTIELGFCSPVAASGKPSSSPAAQENPEQRKKACDALACQFGFSAWFLRKIARRESIGKSNGKKASEGVVCGVSLACLSDE